MNDLPHEPQSPITSSEEDTIAEKLDLSDESAYVHVREQSNNFRRTRHRKRTNWLFLSTLFCFCTAYVVYVFVLPELWPVIYRWRFPKKPLELGMKWWDRNVLRTCEFFFITWFFYLGACIGSFLNVVAWRMPEGRTIVFGGSKCPFCDARLSFIDNTPVIGWLLLRGRCRTCRLPIAPRYLLIEIAVGIAFVWIALWQLIRGGANLPNWRVDLHVGLVATVFDPNWTLIGVSFAHACMFAVLIMLATANTGRRPFPFFPVLVMALAISSAKLCNPKLDFISWSQPFSNGLSARFDPFLNPVISILMGGLVGFLIGSIASFIAYGRSKSIARWHWILQCFLIGSVLGWQSVLTIVLLSLFALALFHLIDRIKRRDDNSLLNHPILISACLILSSALHHSLWRQIAHVLRIV